MADTEEDRGRIESGRNLHQELMKVLTDKNMDQLEDEELERIAKENDLADQDE